MDKNNTRELTWFVTPLNTPSVQRRCAKCSATAEFVSSDKFRINANKRSLDVWLVYKCKKCDNTWNLTIMTRVNADRMDPEEHLRFEKNDRDQAWRCAFDAALLSRAGAQVDWDGVEFNVEGEMAELEEEPLDLHVTADYAIPVRLDKILMRMTGLSRSRLKQLSERGALSVRADKALHKMKFDGDTLIEYRP